jgi:hypothetical protein
MKADARLTTTTRRVIELLVAGEYEAIEQLSNSCRLTAKEIRSAVEEYGERLCVPPRDQFEELDVVEVAASNPKRWSVRIDLWSVREGRSDLSLELTLTCPGSPTFPLKE